ncbi:MAG: NADH-quinone oxidoreductase subunit NuoB [bacterium]
MLDVVKTRLAQGYRTAQYPQQKPAMPDRFKGLPKIESVKCSPETCASCVNLCPAKAIGQVNGRITLDIGKCIFCGSCEGKSSSNTIQFTPEYSMATRKRKDLILNNRNNFNYAEPLDPAKLGLFKKSIRLRQVSAGGCNACEADVNVLNTLVFDLSRFGIQFVASPRHADGLLVTGPLTKNMELALKKTYEALPSPKIVIASGACAISGGMFAEHQEVHKGVDEIIPVDLYIPGCPPHPYTIFDGLLRLLGKVR